MKAFYCHSEWCEESAIVFAETAGKAKWWFINQRCDGDWSGVSCRREKGLDHYGSEHAIPFKELIWVGWHGECNQCGMRMDEDTLQDAGMDVDKVQGFYSGAIYCSPECQEEHLVEKEAKQILQERIIEQMMWRIQDKLPGATIEIKKPYTYTNPSRGLIFDARLSLIIDGYDVEYRIKDRTELRVEGFKDAELFIYMNQNDLPYFEKEYGLKSIS